MPISVMFGSDSNGMHEVGCSQKSTCERCIYSMGCGPNRHPHRCVKHTAEPLCECLRKICRKHRHLGCQCESIAQSWVEFVHSLQCPRLGLAIRISSSGLLMEVHSGRGEQYSRWDYMCSRAPVNLSEDRAKFMSMLPTWKQSLGTASVDYASGSSKAGRGCECDRCQGQTLQTSRGLSVVCRKCANCPVAPSLDPCARCGARVE